MWVFHCQMFEPVEYALTKITQGEKHLPELFILCVYVEMSI